MLGALELSDTSNAPLAREREEKRLQRRGATDEHRGLGLRRGEGWGGKGGRKRDEERGKSVGGNKEGWDRNKREGEGGVRLDLYLIIHHMYEVTDWKEREFVQMKFTFSLSAQDI